MNYLVLKSMILFFLLIQCSVIFGCLLSDSLLRQLPTDAPCYKKIIKNQEWYDPPRITRVCKLSWHIENCLNATKYDEGFENFWKPCCSELEVKEYE